MDYLDTLKRNSNNSFDYVYKTIKIKNHRIDLVNIETITSSELINDFILKKLSYLSNYSFNDLEIFLLNYLPVNSITKLNNFEELTDKLLNGFLILIIDNNSILAIEVKNNLTRGVSEVDYEKTITGSKDCFIEHFNTNLGLIRKRIKSIDLVVDDLEIGKYTKTKVGLIYIKSIAKRKIITDTNQKLKNINIDGIIDSGSLKKYLNNSKSFFPSVKETERPDVACLALLEGKILILVDNSPNVLILPSFFVDYFHASDDYYQKPINITFIRIIRFISFLIACFLPAFYISITTHNPEFMPINLLLSFINQRLNVPFPAFIEGIIMIIAFEILRESDIRIPNKVGSSTSILGGLILGDAAVSAGIISPIMIIVVAISSISSLIFPYNSMINLIRYYRYFILVLAILFGLYGIFIGFALLIINISSITSFGYSYTYPFVPFIKNDIKDSLIKADGKKLRNPLISKKINR